MAELIKESFSLDELSAEEHYAINYVLALLEPEKFSQPFKAAELLLKKNFNLSDTHMRQSLNKGLELLLAKGIIEAKRDGHRDWVPTVFHGSKLVDAKTLIQKPDRLITGDWE